jgi:hypothetical protein
MEYTYKVRLIPSDAWPAHRIRALWSDAECVKISLDQDHLVVVFSDNESIMRRIYTEAKEGGCTCSFEARATYDRSDSLMGDFGELMLGGSHWRASCPTLPRDAMDLTAACPRCGLGAAWVKPHVMTERSIKYPQNFTSGQPGTNLILMRSHIGREVMAATGQPGCMRHPVTPKGRIIEEWMEAVPVGTLPPLSTRCEGVLHGSTRALSHTGEPARLIPPCTHCGQVVWAKSYDVPARLVYDREAASLAQALGVVQMHEPMDVFPTFNPVQNEFKDYYGWPRILFSRAAIQAILKYAQTEHYTDSAWFEPVFSE